MPSYGIMNRDGNVLEWFDDATAAHDALGEMVGEAPDADLVVLAFDEQGDLIGESVAPGKVKVVIEASSWLERSEGSEESAGAGGLERALA